MSPWIGPAATMASGRRDGGLVINMWRLLFPSAIVIFAAAAVWPSAAHAQDRLAGIVSKAKLSKEDIAQIEAEVPDRARRLADAGTNEKERTKARERLLGTIKAEGATKAGLDAYAEACGAALAPLTASGTFAVGLEAVDVLNQLNNPNAAGALGSGLASPHAAVRYKAAKGLRALQGKIKGDATKCREAMNALAAAGAAERDSVVLATIYEAINFYPAASDFQFGADCATALNTLLEGRLKRLREGGLDEQQDLPAFDIAAACQAAADDSERNKLVQHLAPFVISAARRYLDGQSPDDSTQALSASVKRMENSLYALIKGAKKSPPKASLADELASKAAADKKKAAVRSALDELLSMLRGEPWNLG